jgi:hypothetical protein
MIMMIPAEIDRSPSLERRDRKAEIFVMTTLLTSFVLQRFGVPFGAQLISVSVPIVGVMAVWYLWNGVVGIDRRRVAIMLGLISVVILSLNYTKNSPYPFVVRASLTSLLYWLLLTSFAILAFTKSMHEADFFRMVIRVLAFIGVCGIGEFLAQFLGVKLFSFAQFLPARFSFEPHYNVVIQVANTSLIKANGFFLVEPSTFSQFMALGLACEWVNKRRPWFVALFLFALFSAVSGTGWLVVAGFVAYIGLTSGSRGLKTAFLFSCICVLTFGIIGLVLPDITATLTGRVGEFGLAGTSGNGRFVMPFVVMSDVYHRAPEAFFTGIGPGSTDNILGITYDYGLSTPVKILLEYGILGVLGYLVLILANERTPRQNTLLVPALIILLFGGTNTHFAPVLFPILLITTVANLHTDKTS